MVLIYMNSLIIDLPNRSIGPVFYGNVHFGKLVSNLIGLEDQ